MIERSTSLLQQEHVTCKAFAQGTLTSASTTSVEKSFLVGPVTIITFPNVHGTSVVSLLSNTGHILIRSPRCGCYHRLNARICTHSSKAHFEYPSPPSIESAKTIHRMHQRTPRSLADCLMDFEGQEKLIRQGYPLIKSCTSCQTGEQSLWALLKLSMERFPHHDARQHEGWTNSFVDRSHRTERLRRLHKVTDGFFWSGSKTA